MAARSNALVNALATAVRSYPRLSAGLAFELGVMVGAFVKSARRRGLSGASAKLIEAVPLIGDTPASRRKTSQRKSNRRKPAAAKRKPARRAA